MTTLVSTAAYEITTESDLDYLLGSLRIHLGDFTSPYTYSDGFLRKSLVDAFKSLGNRWQRRYNLLVSGYSVVSGFDLGYYSVERNLDKYVFQDEEPPIIMLDDERPLVLMAAINIKRGVLQNISLTLGSWRDDEISQSNIESGKALETSLTLDVNELESILPSRAKKLARASKQSLLGFDSIRNTFEG